MPNSNQAMAAARGLLDAAGIEDAALESEILLRHVLNLDRAALFTQSANDLTDDTYKRFMALVNRRIAGEPSAYITGHKEFFGLDFHVNPSVLIPRPETELLVETALKLIKEREYITLADIGTGSGCIAVSLAKNAPGVSVIAVDISPDALEQAVENSQIHGVQDRITFLRGDLLEPLTGPVDLIAANLPYVDEIDIPSVNTLGFEPESALNGGIEGLMEITRLVRQLPGVLSQGGALLLEIGPGQAEKVRLLLKNGLPEPDILIYKDLAGNDRVVVAVLP